jgi:hypothetical protein
VIIVPSLPLLGGRIARPSPFEVADDVFTGSPADVARRFLAGTVARVFHLLALDKNAAGEPTLRAAEEILAAGADIVLVEGGIADLDACRAIAERGIAPIADEALLDDPRISPAAADAMPRAPLVRIDDDVEASAVERMVRAVERGAWGIVHVSTNAPLSIELAHRSRSMPFFARGPVASEQNVEAVIDHQRMLYRGGVSNVIVDGEWYVDDNTLNEPFDLLRPKAEA